MSDPDRPDQTAEDGDEAATHELSADTLQQPASQFPLPRSKRALVVVTLSLIALAGVSATLVAVVSGGGTSQARSAISRIPSGPPSAAPGTSPGAPAGSGASTLSFPSAAQVAESAGAIGLPANVLSRVITWQFGDGGTRLARVSSLFGTALQQSGLRQYSLMKSTCRQLARSVLTAQAGPPIPVAAMQTLYLQALSELAIGAADCQAAITVTLGDESPQVRVDAALLQQSVSELAAGSRDIFRSTAEIVIASRESH